MVRLKFEYAGFLENGAIALDRSSWLICPIVVMESRRPRQNADSFVRGLNINIYLSSFG